MDIKYFSGNCKVVPTTVQDDKSYLFITKLGAMFKELWACVEHLQPILEWNEKGNKRCLILIRLNVFAAVAESYNLKMLFSASLRDVNHEL